MQGGHRSKDFFINEDSYDLYLVFSMGVGACLPKEVPRKRSFTVHVWPSIFALYKAIESFAIYKFMLYISYKLLLT